jgi:hypothetical protein
MKKRYTIPPLIAATLGLTTIADAHHPEIVAVAGCVQNAQASVIVTATAWATGDPGHRINDAIAIEWLDGTTWRTAAQGAFTIETTSFTRALTLPANSGAPATYRLRARATVAWGDRQQHGSAGEFREASATVTRNCTVPTTTTVATTVPVAPVPSNPPLREVAPEPKLPPVVTSSTVLMRTPSLPEAPPAQAVVETPRFTG